MHKPRAGVSVIHRDYSDLGEFVVAFCTYSNVEVTPV